MQCGTCTRIGSTSLQMVVSSGHVRRARCGCLFNEIPRTIRNLNKRQPTPVLQRQIRYANKTRSWVDAGRHDKHHTHETRVMRGQPRQGRRRRQVGRRVPCAMGAWDVSGCIVSVPRHDGQVQHAQAACRLLARQQSRGLLNNQYTQSAQCSAHRRRLSKEARVITRENTHQQHITYQHHQQRRNRP